MLGLKFYTVYQPKQNDEPTAREKAFYLYGYARRLAEEVKEQGLFPDLSLGEVMQVIIGKLN